MSPAMIAPRGQMDHPAFGVINYRLDPVSDDPDTQVAEVIGMMREYALADAKSPGIIRDANGIVNRDGEPVAGVFKFVQGRMGFTADEITAAPLQRWLADPVVECLIRPSDMSNLPMGVGDCDDYSMYGAALLTALQIPCAFVTVAADQQAPNIYSHVYLAAYPQSGPYAGMRVPLDCSHGQYPGWEVANRLNKRCEWPVKSQAPMLALVAALGLGAFYFYTKSKRSS